MGRVELRIRYSNIRAFRSNAVYYKNVTTIYLRNIVRITIRVWRAYNILEKLTIFRVSWRQNKQKYNDDECNNARVHTI